MNLVYRLCIRYSNTDFEDAVEENYQDCLINFFRYIHTYKPENDNLATWMHCCIKRNVYKLDKERMKKASANFHSIDSSDLSDHIEDSEGCYNALTPENFFNTVGDDMLWAFSQLKDIHAIPLIYNQCGYSLDEIVEICYRKGLSRNKNIDTIKSRIFFAKKNLKLLLTRDGDKREQNPQ